MSTNKQVWLGQMLLNAIFNFQYDKTPSTAFYLIMFAAMRINIALVPLHPH